jgi:hypothetical protein
VVSTWLLAKKCQQVGFFEDYESDQELAKQVDQICIGCPVIKYIVLKMLSSHENIKRWESGLACILTTTSLTRSTIDTRHLKFGRS